MCRTIQTFSDVPNNHCELDFEHSNLAFSEGTLAYDDVPSNYIWLQSTEDNKQKR